MRLLERLSRRLAAIEAILAAGLLVAVFLVVFSQVLMRYLIARPNPWSEELSRFCFIWLSMLGAALAVERRSHFGFGEVLRSLSRRHRRLLRRLADGVMTAVAFLLVVSGTSLVSLSLQERSPALDVPMAFMYAAVPVSGLLMLVHLATRSGEEEGES